jgi:hypothetical protein
MKHVKSISRKPAQAQELSIGQLIAVVAEIMSIIGAALITKDTPPPLPGTGGNSGNE